MVERVLIISLATKTLKEIRPLCIFLSKMSAYRRDFELSSYRRVFHETKCMSFLIKGIESLGKCNEIWKKVKNSIWKGFDSEPVYNAKHLKQNLIMEKLREASIIIKCQKAFLNLFVYYKF